MVQMMDNPDINDKYMHDFKLEEPNSSKDNLDAFFGYNKSEFLIEKVTLMKIDEH